MKKTKYRRLAAMSASLLCCLIFTFPAYAQSSEPQPETASAPAETEAEPEDVYKRQIWGCVGYTVLLCFTLFKTGSLAKSIFGCH